LHRQIKKRTRNRSLRGARHLIPDGTSTAKPVILHDSATQRRASIVDPGFRKPPPASPERGRARQEIDIPAGNVANDFEAALLR